MSHFTVLVIGENLEGQLLPYEEQTTNPEYLEFENTEEKERKKYETESIDLYLLPNGEKVLKWKDKEIRPFINHFLPKNYDESPFEQQAMFQETCEKAVESGILVPVDQKFTERYSSFEAYMEGWCGYDERDPKTGKYGYYHNPNSKWDWWTIGGRWTGYFKTKKGATGILGKSGVFGNKPRGGWVDQVRKGDIDLEYMREHARKQAVKEYDAFSAVVNGIEPPKKAWKDFYPDFGDDIQKAREEWHNHPWVKAISKSKLDCWNDPMEVYCVLEGGREKYIQRAVDSVIVPFAVLKDGQWFEKGKMGLAMISDEINPDTWNEQVNKLIDELPDETLITAVDCHI